MAEHQLRPRRPTWTHIALKVKDIDATIAWYERHTHLKLLQRGQDEAGRNAWLADETQADQPFVLVVGEFFEGKDPFAPAAHPPLGPFAHIGIELPTREAVDKAAALGKKHGCLALGPLQMPKQIGYICFLKDPDGNTIEFSFDQGVYEKAREVWGAKAEAV
ncbi:MAG TPA: VOC family protein [Caulobacteraceae bacterium]|nr:VOC family protein [Caulobacteraceae bacterium]